ncbi:hypothetical protein [Agrobacterium sp. NPDC089420]|uniref:hypothetical protein n=1 Tax=Agrobacterium sp. NPDC089420 TaxID=3363918 RepID=UPI00384CB23B
MAQTYSTERILATSTTISGKFSRRKVDLGESGFSFSTILSENMHVWVDSSPVKEGVVARIYDPEDRDKLMIEVHHIRFPSFADADTAGYGFFALNGYNRILQDPSQGNSVFGFLAASEFKEGTGYGRMSRLAAVSYGSDVLIIQAGFDYDDYPAYEDALSRFFGGLEMEDESAAFKSLKEQTAKGGEIFLYPEGWDVKTLDSSNKPQGTSDYNLSMNGEEYPNLVVHIRPVDLAKGREVAADMISTFTKQIDDSSEASFVGEADMETIKNSSGEPVAHAYARGWDTTNGGHFVTEIHVQKNANASSISVLGVNTYDARRNIRSFDEETQDIIFKSWVTGISAYSVVKKSLAMNRDSIEQDFDLRALGH